MKFVHFTLAFVCCMFSTLASSQNMSEGQTKIDVVNPSQSYAIVSIIGDKLSVVTEQFSTGTNLDPNRREAISLPKDGLDGQILLIVDNTIKRQCPACKTTLMKAGPIATPEEGESLLPSLLNAARQSGAKYLVVLTKHKDEARLTYDGSSLGQGKLTGLGFYIDRTKRVKNLQTLETGTGYLGPYAYFKTYLIEVASGNVVFRQSHIASTRVAATQKGDFDPWNAIPANRKIPVLLDLVRDEVDRVLDFRKLGLMQ
jgi:hypothetical protein